MSSSGVRPAAPPSAGASGVRRLGISGTATRVPALVATAGDTRIARQPMQFCGWADTIVSHSFDTTAWRISHRVMRRFGAMPQGFSLASHAKCDQPKGHPIYFQESMLLTADRRRNAETATTFRDPAGHVTFEENSVRRHVRPAY